MATPKKDFHLLIDPELLKAAKIKALQEDTAIADVVAKFLRAWLDGKVKLPR
jgi:hypothetical protein